MYVYIYIYVYIHIDVFFRYSYGDLATISPTVISNKKRNSNL